MLLLTDSLLVIFRFKRGVTQGDPPLPYLFILVLVVLAITIRGDPRIRGVNVDGDDIKLQIFADDLKGCVRNEQSLNRFLIQLWNLVRVQAPALTKIKRRYFFLGITFQNIYVNDETEIWKGKVNRVVKILGAHFTYDTAQFRGNHALYQRKA